MQMERSHFEEAINRLDVYFTTTTVPIVRDELYFFVQKWDLDLFKASCRWLSDNFEQRSYKKFPRKPDFERAKQQCYSKLNPVKHYKPSIDDASQQEVDAFFKCVMLINECHVEKIQFEGKVLDRRKGCLAMNFDEWAKAGQPETWSPLYDVFAQSCIIPIRKSIADKSDVFYRHLIGWIKLLDEMIDKKRKGVQND